jgi:hypothetical protein
MRTARLRIVLLFLYEHKRFIATQTTPRSLQNLKAKLARITLWETWERQSPDWRQAKRQPGDWRSWETYNPVRYTGCMPTYSKNWWRNENESQRKSTASMDFCRGKKK